MTEKTPISLPRFIGVLVIISVVVAGSLAVFRFSAQKQIKEPGKEIIVTDTAATKSATEIVEQLRESTTSIKPEMVTERLTIDPADGNLVKIVDRKLTVKKDNNVWEFLVAEDAELTRTTLPATAEGGQLPTTGKISLNDLKVGDHLVAVLERLESGQVVSRRINVLVQTP